MTTTGVFAAVAALFFALANFATPHSFGLLFGQFLAYVALRWGVTMARSDRALATLTVLALLGLPFVVFSALVQTQIFFANA